MSPHATKAPVAGCRPAERGARRGGKRFGGVRLGIRVFSRMNKLRTVLVPGSRFAERIRVPGKYSFGRRKMAFAGTEERGSGDSLAARI